MRAQSTTLFRTCGLASCMRCTTSRVARRSRPGCFTYWRTVRGQKPPEMRGSFPCRRSCRKRRKRRNTPSIRRGSGQPTIDTLTTGCPWQSVPRRDARGAAARRGVGYCGAQRARETAAAQAEVVRLRDIEGMPGDEVCRLLSLTEGNQRVLLHRGRSKIRSTLEIYLSTRAD